MWRVISGNHGQLTTKITETGRVTMCKNILKLRKNIKRYILVVILIQETWAPTFLTLVSHNSWAPNTAKSSKDQQTKRFLLQLSPLHASFFVHRNHARRGIEYNEGKAQYVNLFVMLGTKVLINPKHLTMP
jgi:hypothetical protein